MINLFNLREFSDIVFKELTIDSALLSSLIHELEEPTIIIKDTQKMRFFFDANGQVRATPTATLPTVEKHDFKRPLVEWSYDEKSRATCESVKHWADNLGKYTEEGRYIKTFDDMGNLTQCRHFQCINNEFKCVESWDYDNILNDDGQVTTIIIHHKNEHNEIIEINKAEITYNKSGKRSTTTISKQQNNDTWCPQTKVSHIQSTEEVETFVIEQCNVRKKTWQPVMKLDFQYNGNNQIAKIDISHYDADTCEWVSIKEIYIYHDPDGTMTVESYDTAPVYATGGRDRLRPDNAPVSPFFSKHLSEAERQNYANQLRDHVESFRITNGKRKGKLMRGGIQQVGKFIKKMIHDEVLDMKDTSNTLLYQDFNERYHLQCSRSGFWNAIAC